VSGWESWWAEPGAGLGTVEGIEERRSAKLDMVGALVEDGDAGSVVYKECGW